MKRKMSARAILLLFTLFMVFNVTVVILSHYENNRETTTSVVTPTPTVVPTPTPIEEKEYVVVADKVNIRESASIKSKVVGMYSRYDKIVASKFNNEWLSTEKGFVSRYYTIPAEEYSRKLHSYTVSRGGLPMRSIESIRQDIGTKSNLTLQEIQILLKNTNMKGIEEAVLDVEEKYHINGFITIAVAKLESACGTSNIARDKHNLFGLGAFDYNPYDNAIYFDNMSESVYKFGRFIKNNFLDNNIKTLSSIKKIYCSDTEWDSKIINIVKTDYFKVKR